MTVWNRLLAIGAFGALGAICRYLVGLAALQTAPGAPWLGTLVANGVGCLLFGLVFRVGADGALLGSEMKLLLLTGFLGAFTTFSAYAHDGIALAQHRSVTASALYLIAQNAVGLAATLVGMFLGGWIAARAS